MLNRSTMTALLLLTGTLMGCQHEQTPPKVVPQVTVTQEQAAPAHSQVTPVAPTPTGVAVPVTPAVIQHATTKPAASSTVREKPVVKAAVAKPVPAQPAAASKSTVLTETAALQLAGKNNCLACHAINKKLVGPAWKAVADKYRGDASAQSRLESKVSKGGSGAWGSMAMPANSPRVKAEDITSLIRFILSLQ